MGGPGTSVQVLLLSVASVVFISALVSANSNPTSGPGSVKSENSNASNPSDGFQDTCHAINLQDAGLKICAAVDMLAEELSCERGENASLPEDKSREVEQSLGQIVKSTFKVLFQLGANESGFNVLDTFGVLDSLNLGNHSDLSFIRRWFSVKMAPLLPYVDENFLTQLSSQNFSCTSFQELIEAMSDELEQSPKVDGELIYTHFIQAYLSRKDLPDPGCTQNVNGSAEWLKRNIGNFSVFASHEDLHNIYTNSSVSNMTSGPGSVKSENSNASNPSDGFQETCHAINLRDAGQRICAAVDMLAEELSCERGENASLPEDKSREVEQSLGQIVKSTFKVLFQLRNITVIKNPAVRDTILNLTLAALAPEFEEFEPEDFELWFQRHLTPVMASLRPGSLVVIPRNISCASYAAILTGLQQSLESVPLDISYDVRSSIKSLKKRFPRCSVPDSFMCKETPVDEDHICAAFERSQIEHTLSVDSSSEALCNFTITENACSSATHLTASNVATLMNCSMHSHRPLPVEVWKLFFQKASTALDGALMTFATMAPRDSNPSLSHMLEALGEVRIANFSQAQLQNETFVSNWFQTKIRPFLASPSPNFLFCLSAKNFSCHTYQTVIQAFNSQMAYMDRQRQHTVYTHFIKPFLSRNDSSDPGCVSFDRDSEEWLRVNLGGFSGFATLQDLQALNANFSSAESLSVLTPAQVAQFTLSSGALNDTNQIDRVFDRLVEGDALENVDEFLTELAAEEKEPDFQPPVRDRVMNRTFAIISPHFPQFEEADWFMWFHVTLVTFLPSFSPMMLKNATSDVNCTNYHVVVSGLAKAHPAMSPHRQQEITRVLLGYMRKSAGVINKPVCRRGIQNDSEWVGANLGPFSQHATYSDLKVFNLSKEEVLESLSPNQKAELLLDPDSGALEDEVFVREVLTGLTESPDDDQLEEFFEAFADINKQRNITVIKNPAVRDTILNLTLAALAPEFEEFEPEDFELWFQRHLTPVMASLRPGSLVVIPRNISCASYAAILTGLQQSLESVPLDISYDVRSSIKSLKKRFPRCSVPDSFMCKETPVDEDHICAAFERSQIEHTLSVDSSSEALCNFTITENACSSAPRDSNPSLSHMLEALGEVRIANFSQAQLQNETFVSKWFQTKIRPFLASPSPNFLFCLSAKNFSCHTYQTVIQAFNSQMAYMDRQRQHTVYTHFIKPFLSRNDSSDPGCVSFDRDSEEWLRANLGGFSGFATLQDLQALNANFSSAESLSVLTPAQVAQFTLSSGALNDTNQIDRVFDRLVEGDALENVDEFLTELAAEEKEPDFQPPVRDRVMNRTFAIISPHFPQFEEADWFMWFHVTLVTFLPSFSPMMLKNATSDVNCTNYHVIVSGLAKAHPAMSPHRQQEITRVLLGYMRKSAGVINKPVCRRGIQNDSEWVGANLGPFSQHATYSDLKVFNLSKGEVLESLSPNQKAELLLDPDSGALEDEVFVREVLTGLTESPDDDQLEEFFEAFADINKQRNITVIKNPAVRDTILNLTLAALAPEFEEFEPEDFELWFQRHLTPVMASLRPGSLVVIPRNISCASYAAILTGLQQSLESVPLDISYDVRSSIKSLKKRFPRCSVPDSFMCKETPVDEDHICAAFERSQIEHTLSVDSSSEALCNFTITENACSSATHLTASNVATLMNCSMQSHRPLPVEVWKLFFQKASTALDGALMTFATMAPRDSNPSLSHMLEALGEVRIANFSQAQLQNETFVSKWFQTKIRPFLASPSPNFLFCLSAKNFSCHTYQTVIQAFNSQMAYMDRQRQHTVYTHFIKPFLSRNDSSDPGCVSFDRDSEEWLRANLGGFSGFATLQDLQALNANFSSAESLSVLTPAQVAQFTLSSGALNDTNQIDRVFDRLVEGDALENVDEFLTELAAEEKEPDFQPPVRDRVMNRTFAIISPHFPQFEEADWFMWFHVTLVTFLPSFSPMMLKNATSDVNCTNYHVIVSGLAKAHPAMSPHRQQEITRVLLGYMRKSAGVINKPVCRRGIQNDSEWVGANLGPFSQHATYSDLKVFNLSKGEVLESLSPNQKAELLLDPDSGALEDEVFVREVLTGLTESPDDDQLEEFFEAFADINKQRNITVIKNPAVRDTILNLTLAALAPEFEEFEPEDFELWFQRHLTPVMASLRPGSLVVIPRNISCASYAAILTGLQQSLESVPLDISYDVRSSIKSLKKRFPRCSVPDSFMCKETPVDEDHICAAFERSQIEHTLSVDSSSEALCNFTITENACSSATHLTASNVATLMNCSMQSHRPLPVEVWKLFFQKASTALDGALMTFATMAPRDSNPSLSHMLEALGEVRIANFNPGCVSFDGDSEEWLRANLGGFSGFATLQDLQALNANFSSAESLSVLTPTQVAQFTLSSGALNDTNQIDRVFDRLEEGDALENVDEFLTELAAEEKEPDFQPPVRDRVMNRTFAIISPHFPQFEEADWFMWFHVTLVTFLPSFSPMMLKNATSDVNCTNYHVIVSGLAKAHPAMSPHRQQEITRVLLGYMRKSAGVINKPVCRRGIQNDSEWVGANLGPFSQHATYSDLKVFNLSKFLESLSPNQKAELLLDPDSGALEDEVFVREVLTGLTESPDDDQLEEFFEAFADINKQRNITVIKNPAVRDTILNLTLAALAPEFEEFEPEDFELWFQRHLTPVMASLRPGSLVVIPRNISCASYAAILTGLQQSLESVPLDISYDVRSSIKSLKKRFPRCSVPDSFMCKETPVDEDHICAAFERSQIEHTLSVDSSSEALCNFTITENACSSATHLTASNVATLMNCSMQSHRPLPVEVWKLFFQKASTALDGALMTFATMAPRDSNPSLSHMLEALGEVRIANFSQAQLQNETFVSKWFQTKIRPFLASPSPNFLFCLSAKNFSCHTYQTVIQAFNSQMAYMDRQRQHTVYTHFIKPFLSRNDSSDPGCVSFDRDSEEWLRANLGGFSGFATLQDLQALNANFSSAESLSVLTPTQVAQFTLSSGALNDTNQIDRVFDRLEEGDALENVDEFLTELAAEEKEPDFQPPVRDRVMNRTFAIISPHFPQFEEADWFMWFHVTLVTFLPSFSPMMLKNATSDVNCTNYHVIVSGLAKAHPAMSPHRQQEITRVLLGYMRKSAGVINKPVCRRGIQNDSEWVGANLGPFSQHATYSDLKVFNLSKGEVLESLSPNQKAELLLDPDSGALEDEVFVREVLTGLTESPDDDQLEEFFEAFADINKQRNITVIKNPAVRDTILNLTLAALAPEFEEFEPEDFELWFQRHLTPVMASLRPGSLVVIPRNISCASYAAILTGLQQSLESVPLDISYDVRSSIKSLKKRFPRCSVPDSFMCKETPVDEDHICAAFERSQIEHTLSVDSSSEALCNFTITENACSSATHLTASNVATLMNCSMQSHRPLPVEVWKLFFQKASTALDGALMTFATMAPRDSNPSLSHMLEALGEVRIANFSQAQLQNETFVSNWFQTKIRPFLASPSPNFLFCLSAKNFSCHTYQTVIQAFNSQMAYMDRQRQHTVYTHFIKPFLSRNDSSDPGCVSFDGDSEEWLRANLGGFSGFATLQDLQALNANFSSAESLSVLTPTQVAQFTLSSGALNDTNQIDRVFDRLEEGDALENVDEFLTELAAEEKEPDFQPPVRDRVMNRTFAIISPHFPQFEEADWFMWFHVTLVTFLPSFSPMMLKNATSDVNCTNYHVIVSGLAKAHPAMSPHRQQEITRVLLGYMRKSAGVINKPVCRRGIQNDSEWVGANLGPFSQHATYSDLKVFNLSKGEVLESLSPNQKAELLLDPDSGALEDEVFVREVLTGLTESPDDDQLEEFFEAFADINKQRNITVIKNPAVRDTILNLTLAALAPEFEEFEPEDFELWFQRHLTPVMASLRPGSLVVIPRNISCASYAAILTGLQQSLESVPLDISYDVRSSIKSLKKRFPRCSVPDSFMCKETPVDEDHICAAFERSQIEHTLSVDSSSEALCNFTITENACSSATHLTASNVATLMNCSMQSHRPLPVEVWKLFFQKASTALDGALMTFATMAPRDSNPSLSHMLEALGEVRIANFSQAQLQNETFVSKWFQTKIRPFLASPSPNFLFCLSAKNFSCHTYQTVIQAFNSQMAYMDRQRQHTVYTHFIKPFLSRNDSSDPGCVSFDGDSEEWLRANLGGFSGFATLQDLQALNANFSSAESLSVLTPTQVAQFTLSSGALNDTNQIDRVFDRLEEGDALENVDEFLTELAAEEKEPDFQPPVRDRVMNRTFAIISPHFPQFEEADWFMWFHVTLVTFLPSFSPMMLKNATSDVNCTNYHVIVSGLAKAHPAMSPHRQQEITRVLLGYMRKSAGVINKPVCRRGIQNDSEWVGANLGPFSQHATYSDLKVFNLSKGEVLESLSPNQKAELLLDPDSGALEDEVFVREVLTGLTESPDDDQLEEFFEAFADINKQRNITVIKNPAVRDTILNLTLAALAPEFEEFEPEDFELWFQRHLTPVMASLRPGSLVVIPRNISCASYAAILTGLQQSLESVPLDISYDVRSSIKSLKKRFPRCSVPDSFMCKETPVDEDHICAAFERSQIEHTLSVDSSSEALCNFTITENACSSATHLTASNVATLMNCSMQSHRPLPVEVWKLFFQKASTALDGALMTFATMAPRDSNPSLSHMLEALGEVRIANFSQAQLQNETFVSKWFQTKIRPFLASPSPNFLFCLSAKNFSCHTYQTVIQAFNSQMAYMDRQRQHTVYTHFIKPFLSRNDSSDPGCVSFDGDSEEWLRANLGGFSGFATLQDLQALNANFSSAESLSVLTPTQVAQFTLSSGALNDTNQIDRVFDRLEEGDALENVDEFLTELAAEEKEPDFQPPVRDRVMNRTFAIISPHFPQFEEADWFMWFHVTLVTFLPSFSPMMLKNATSDVNCTNYHVIVSGLAKAHPAMSPHRQQEITRVLLGYMRKSAGVINKPVCRRGIQNDSEWVGANLGPFSQHATYSDLKVFNLSKGEVLESLSPNQKAELLLDPDSGALEDEVFVREVLTGLTESPDDDQLEEFFEAFADINKQRNITVIKNPAVRDTILNLTLAALAPEFEEFEPEDFELWFQRHLTPVMASLRPGSLVVIPRNISCASYAAILTGLQQSLESVPLDISYDVRSSIKSLKKRFPRCSVPDSFMCKETPVDEDHICAAFERSQIEHTLSVDSSSEALCNFTITENACSSATHLTASNVATLMNCSMQSHRPLPVEVWKLFFQKASTALDGALMTFATMAPRDSNPSLSHMLEALGEVRIANFSQAQLQNETFVSKWFQTKIRPFLASPSPNFLFCLSAKNFSCHTYQTVIQAFNSQMAYMDRQRQHTVYTHFIKPFLSRNDSSDPGCVSFDRDSEEWLRANLGGFSGFATLQDLQALNANFSSAESLSVLTPTQVAQFTLSSGALNDTNQIDRVFDRLEEGDALENVDEFLTELAAEEKEPDFQPPVRDRVMNRTFAIISPHFPQFEEADWFMWFHVTLVTFLPSFSPMMLKNATSDVNCTNYHVIVSGLAKAHPAMSPHRQQEITRVLLGYMRKSAGVINKPVCRQGIQSDAEWLQRNLGPFSQYTTYADLKAFNLSEATVLDSLSSAQKAELLLEPKNLSNETLVRIVFTELTASSRVEDLGSFFDGFVSGAAEQNLTTIDPRVRDTILNLTLVALGPELSMLDAEGFKLWFQVYLPLFLPGIMSSTFEIIPRNISCDSYQEIVKGCDNVFTHLSVRQTQQVFAFIMDFLRTHSSSGRSCVEPVNDDRRWLKDNFGQFRVHASYMDFVTLKNNFNGVEVADLLTISQLAHLAATPSQLQDMEDVTEIMTAIDPVDFGTFFDTVSPAIEEHPVNYTEEVKSAFLQAVIDRGDLSSSAINDTEFLQWLRIRLSPLVVNLSPSLLLSTISTSELNQFLSQPNVIDKDSDICVIFNNYNNTPAFLETEDVPDDVKEDILPCVWPLALSSNSRAEVNAWFDQRLTNYLRFLSKSLISSNEVQNASCLAFQKFVSVLGNNFTYNNSEFGQQDVYTTISTYLMTGSEARCYNASDAELNSTAWFANYIGSFVSFVTVDDLTTFTSTSQAGVFLVDEANLELFNNTAIPEDVTDLYISKLYEFNPTFKPLKLPGFFLCSDEVPSSAYSSVNEEETILVLNELDDFCNGTQDPEVSAALASNIQTFTPDTFKNLGSASSGLTSSQITSISPSVLVSSLPSLSSVSTWNQEQATIIIQTITASGFLINSGSSLESLGALLAGVPSESIQEISASELASISQSSTFVSNMLAAPTVIQQTYVQKVISVDTNPVSVVQNVPDSLATEIPPSLLLFSDETADISVINKKEWTGSQATMFFGTLAETNFDIEQLSPSVLQGFTCTSVKRMTKTRIRKLIRSCRPRRGRAKVQLQESQLTCMYNLLNGNISQTFTDYPSDMLLYLDTKDVKSANCRSYFSAVGAADFSVASSILNKNSLLLSEARTCLGISGVSLSSDNVEVLGNMACTLDSSYIQNSDPLILEKLKSCKDFSASQVDAMETLLLSGKTRYGNVTTWNRQTLGDLGSLPLYLTRNFWGQFKTSTKRRFFKTYMPKLRKRKTKKTKLKALFTEASAVRVRRGAGCTEGNITQVTVSDNAFPFGYDQTQFDLCLDIPVLKDNLNSICEKVDDNDLQLIILKKLNQAYPSGVPEEKVQVLGSVSRVASLNDISKWTITKVDTLAALMNSDDGSWEAAKSKAIITKYLDSPGNSLGSTELNSIDSNLCSLDTSTLNNITADSIRNAKPLNLASCSLEQKKVLYEISKTAFSSEFSNSTIYYNLIKSYLGGAPVEDVIQLSTQGISMDVAVFSSLDSNVISSLNVTHVRGLVGSHLQDLKLFENDTAVEMWRNMQTQADLDTLAVGLTTTRATPTTASPSSTAPPRTTNAPTTAAGSTVASTQGNTLGSNTTLATTVKTTQGNTLGSDTTLATIVTTAQANTTSGVTKLAKQPTSILLAALLTTVLQILQQPA
ncbi:hypothetical protein ABVT39_022377 [Epinephelus coioides]